MIHLYARVSTAEQAADGTTSIEEQLRRGRAIAQIRGAGAYDIATYEDRGVSGSIPLAQRPQGREMLFGAKAGDTICAAKLDRLFRSARDALNTADALKSRGIDLVLVDMGTDPVTANGTAKMFFGMLALVAEFERERIAERIQDGRRAKKEKGGHIGGLPPYGWRREGSGRDARLVLDENEQASIHHILDFHHRGFAPSVILKSLARHGYMARDNKPFGHMQLKRILAQAEKTQHAPGNA